MKVGEEFGARDVEKGGCEGGKKLDLFRMILHRRSRGGCCHEAMMEKKMIIDKTGNDCTVVACMADGRSDAAALLCSERASDAHLTAAMHVMTSMDSPIPSQNREVSC